MPYTQVSAATSAGLQRLQPRIGSQSYLKGPPHALPLQCHCTSKTAVEGALQHRTCGIAWQIVRTSVGLDSAVQEEVPHFLQLLLAVIATPVQPVEQHPSFHLLCLQNQCAPITHLHPAELQTPSTSTASCALCRSNLDQLVHVHSTEAGRRSLQIHNNSVAISASFASAPGK